MSIKPRSPGQTAISVSLPADLVEEIDARANALGISRSQYLVHLARADLIERGELTLRETASSDPRLAVAEAAAAKAVEEEVTSYGKSAKPKRAPKKLSK